MKRQECSWHFRICEEVRLDSAVYTDYRLEDGKLYRHIYHSLDFKDTAAVEQETLCTEGGQERGVTPLP